MNVLVIDYFNLIYSCIYYRIYLDEHNLKIVYYWFLVEIWNLVLVFRMVYISCCLLVDLFSLLLPLISNFVFFASNCYFLFRYFLIYFNLNHNSPYFIIFFNLVKIYRGQNVLFQKVLTPNFKILHIFYLFLFINSDVFY